MEPPPPPWYTGYSSKRTRESKTEREEMKMKHVMRDVALAILAVAVVIAAQVGLSFVVGFRTAEIIGQTAMTALFLYAIIRAGRKRK